MAENHDRADRVRERTAPEINERIDLETEASIWYHATKGEADLERRIRELDEEWDVERVLVTNASALALAGLAVGTTINRRWLALPWMVLPFLLQHALQGWCPPLAAIRRFFGVRTRKEVDRERYALKALRGDFADVTIGDAELDAVVGGALASVSH